MSLIINMLKDLDNRQNNASPSMPMITTHQKRSHGLIPSPKIILIATFIILFLGITSYLVMHRRTPYKGLTLPKETAVIKTTSNETDMNEPALTPVIINGVSFEAKNDTTEMTMALNHDTLYRLVSNGKNDTITLYIDNASMLSDLPTLIGTDVGIQNITSTADNNNLKFVMTLKKGAFLKSINLNKDSKTPELIITIDNPQTAPQEVAKTTAGIKSPAMQSILTDQYEVAIKFAETGNKQEAIERLTKLINYYPDYNDARVALAAIIFETGNPVQARKIIDDGLALSPDYLPLIELKARLLTSQGNIKEALMVLQSEQPPMSEAPNYHALIAALYSRENNHKFAVDIYQKLVQLDQHEGSWWFGLGVSLDKLGHNQDAVYAYTKAATEGRLNAQAVAFLHTRLKALQEDQHVKQ